MATIEGGANLVGEAVGLGDEVGSLEAGKQADLILVDLTELNLSPVLEAPVRNIVPNLVYAGSGHEVRAVMVAGKVLVRAAWPPTRCTERWRCWKQWHKDSYSIREGRWGSLNNTTRAQTSRHPEQTIPQGGNSS
jgi:hypothetical protein